MVKKWSLRVFVCVLWLCYYWSAVVCIGSMCVRIYNNLAVKQGRCAVSCFASSVIVAITLWESRAPWHHGTKFMGLRCAPSPCLGILLSYNVISLVSAASADILRRELPLLVHYHNKLKLVTVITVASWRKWYSSSRLLAQALISHEVIACW